MSGDQWLSDHSDMDEAFTRGNVGEASPEQLEKWLKATGRVPNEQFRLSAGLSEFRIRRFARNRAHGWMTGRGKDISRMRRGIGHPHLNFMIIFLSTAGRFQR